MYINKLTLKNFRGIHSLSIELDQHLNVFVGINGSGKSSMLDASAIMLSWLVNRIKSSSASGRPITEVDIRNGQADASIELIMNASGETLTWRLAKTRRGRVGQEKPSMLKMLSLYAKSIQTDITENQNISVPLLAYYPVNRVVLDIPLRIRSKHNFDLLDAYDGSLTSGANFRTFFEWFREREDLENENRNQTFSDHQLQAVRHALTQFMPEFTDLRVRRNPLRMEVKKQGETLTVDQLSDGEKCLMALIGDIARRLAIANPAEYYPLEGDGIVLIDEVDLHLHPKWQRMIVPKLREVFPNCQLCISTHSPHVLTHVKANSIHMMYQTSEGLKSSSPIESYGKNVDRILEDLMGLDTTRPDKVTRDLHKIFEQINEGTLDKARKSIMILKEKIGDDPELVKAEVLIKRKELIGK